jgi:hypothetical protein
MTAEEMLRRLDLLEGELSRQAEAWMTLRTDVCQVIDRGGPTVDVKNFVIGFCLKHCTAAEDALYRNGLTAAGNVTSLIEGKKC